MDECGGGGGGSGRHDDDDGGGTGADMVLIFAAVNGNVAVVRGLLKGQPQTAGANKEQRLGVVDVDKPAILGRTALHYAVLYGHTEVARLLLDAGADKTIRSRFGQTPLDLAIEKNRADCIELISGHTHERASFWRAAQLGQEDEDQLRSRLEQATLASLSPAVALQSSYLRWAVVDGHANAVKVLLSGEHEHDVDALLFAAVENGHADCARVLIERGGARATNALKNNNGGESLMHAAVKSQNPEVVRLLLALLPSNSLSIDARLPCNLWTPLHYAARQGSTTIVRLLLEHGGADVDPIDCWGTTPVTLAIRSNHIETIELLYSHGAQSTECCR